MSEKLTVIARGGIFNCSGGKCPTLYRASDGRLFVQGYVVKDEVLQGVDGLPDGETLVEISAELIKNIKDLK